MQLLINQNHKLRRDIMRQRRKGLGGGSVFRTPYVPIPINKTALHGIVNGGERVRDHDSDSNKIVAARKSTKTTGTSNAKQLPPLAYFRVQYSKTFLELCNAPWIILVSCKGDGKGLRLASDVGNDSNIKIKECFETREEAIEFGKQCVSSWGK